MAGVACKRQPPEPTVETNRGPNSLTRYQRWTRDALENLEADLQDLEQRRSLCHGALDPSISSTIDTRDRCHQLVRCLQSVKSITFERSWELLLLWITDPRMRPQPVFGSLSPLLVCPCFTCSSELVNQRLQSRRRVRDPAVVP